ncbi:MAG: hypothetical protein C4326_05175 [Ignavibacteria bacterium]
MHHGVHILLKMESRSRLFFLLNLLLGLRLTLSAQSTFWLSTSGPSHAGAVNALQAFNTTAFAGTDIGGVFARSDGDTAWRPLKNGLHNIYIRSLAIDSNGVLYAGTQGGGVFRSSDGGESWHTTALTTLWTIRTLVAHAGYILAGTSGGGVFKSTDAGATWFAAHAGLADPYVRSLAVSPKGTLIAGTAFAGMFRSTDSGSSWQSVGITTQYEVRALASRNDGVFFAGGYGSGMFRSSDDGQTWIAVNEGLTNGTIEWITSNRSGKVYVATRGGGVFSSSNNGAQWHSINNGLGEWDVRSLAVRSDDVLLAGTASAGVFMSSHPTSVVDDRSSTRPTTFELAPCFPNPFNAVTTIRYTIRSTAPMSMTFRVFDALGREVALLVRGEQAPGTYGISFVPQHLAGGIYYGVLSSGNRSIVQRMMVIR